MRIMVDTRIGRGLGRTALILAVAGTMGGCAMKGDVRDLQDEIRALSARQDSLLRRLAFETQSTQDTLRTQSDQMFDFRGDISRQLREIGEGVRTLEALVGQNQRAISGIRDQLANTRSGGAAGGGPVTSPSTGESLVGGSTGNADQTWRSAMEQYSRESFNTALAAFREFLSANPSDPRAPDAHFYVGDILAAQNRPEDALSAFQQIPALFPTAAKVPDALYRIGVLQEELGRIDDARTTFRRIVNTYPGTVIAELAQERLDEIG